MVKLSTRGALAAVVSLIALLTVGATAASAHGGGSKRGGYVKRHRRFRSGFGQSVHLSQCLSAQAASAAGASNQRAHVQ